MLRPSALKQLLSQTTLSGPGQILMTIIANRSGEYMDYALNNPENPDNINVKNICAIIWYVLIANSR